MNKIKKKLSTYLWNFHPNVAIFLRIKFCGTREGGWLFDPIEIKDAIARDDGFNFKDPSS